MRERDEEVFERALWMVRNNRYWSRREATVVLSRRIRSVNHNPSRVSAAWS